MSAQAKNADPYRGFEQGPIRPPSEAQSLLLRVTRNCPWNRCSFCPVYKGTTFSIRPVEHVRRDIDAVHKHVETLRGLAHPSGQIDQPTMRRLIDTTPSEESQALAAALHWFLGGRMKSVFLQDANTLAIKAADLIDILNHLKMRFPSVQRTTSYARAQTVAAKRESDLKAIRQAGLDRIHVGLESGSNEVLAAVNKGATKEQHIVAGCKAKRAGMELSEYVMPGLGGRRLSQTHALETADALNRIDPDFIRLRTLAIPRHIPLFEDYEAGRFEKCTDLMMVEEILTLIEHLDGITSVVKSDHVLSLFPGLQGKLPRDKDRMIDMLRSFLLMDAQQQRLFQVGRRIGIFSRLRDMEHPQKMAQAEVACRELGITPENVDEITDQIMTTYI